jgi:hypothetical protein
MSGTDTRLRELLETAVGEPPNSVSVTEVRRLARRRRTRHGITAASAAAACCAVVSVLASGLAGPLFGHSSSPLPAASPQAGLPRYYIQQQALIIATAPVPGNRAVVRDTATGAVTAAVRCPWARSGISQIAAARDDVFFMACQRTSGSSFGVPDVVGTRLYRFQLTSAGRVPRYFGVPGGVLPGVATYGLTAAADGSELAMNISTGRPNLPGFRAPGVLVINTRTGGHALWRAPSTLLGFIYADLTLSPNGRDLSFLNRQNRQKECLVSPASRGGELSSARVLVRVPSPKSAPLVYIPYAQLSSGGSVLTVAEVVHGPRYFTVVVEQISVASGRVIRVLFRVGVRWYPDFVVATSDPMGRHIILSYSPNHRVSNGWLDHDRLVPLTPVHTAVPIYDTW